MRSPLILTGGPAVGKTTTAGALAETLDRAAVIDVDDIRQLIRSGHAAPWAGAEGRLQQRLGVENACALAARFLANGFGVIVTDVLSAETLQLYRRLLPRCQIVRLYATQDEACRRARTRPTYLTEEEFSMLHADEARGTVLADQQLDVTAMSPQEQLAAVLAVWSCTVTTG